jgi:hypothetical protein
MTPAFPYRAPESAGSDADDDDDTALDEGDGAARREQTIDDERYRLISIDAVGAPEGCTGTDWHVYRIAQGGNGITGYRHGELALVTTEVEAIVTALNGRRRWTKTKAPSKYQRRAAAAARRASK